jgi:hypothetical protein
MAKLIGLWTLERVFSLASQPVEKVGLADIRRITYRPLLLIPCFAAA